MFFVINGLYKADAQARRADHVAAHRAFLADSAKLGIRIVLSGPLVQDDGKTPIGSHIVIKAADRNTAETFHHADPFFKAGIWEKTTVTAFDKQVG